MRDIIFALISVGILLLILSALGAPLWVVLL